MNDNIVKRVVLDFAKEHKQEYKKSFKVTGNDEEIFIVTVERKRRILVTESISMEARSNTISALPPGAACGCCGGSGKSS